MVGRVVAKTLCIALGLAGASAVAQAQTPPVAEPREIISNPSVLAPPDADKLSRLYPAAAFAQGKEGAAVLACEVTKEGALANCTFSAEYPVGFGFGEAAIKAAPFFKMKPKTINGVPVDGGHINIRVHFTAPAAPVEIPVDHPWWTCPNPGTSVAHASAERYYPERAQAKGIKGAADVQCRISTDGRPEACVWISETQPNLGFGDSAEKLACSFRFSAGEERGAPTPSLWRSTIRFDLAQ